MANNYLLDQIIHASDKPTAGYFNAMAGHDKRQQMGIDNRFRQNAFDQGVKERETDRAAGDAEYRNEQKQKAVAMAARIALDDPEKGVAYLNYIAPQFGEQPVTGDKAVQYAQTLQAYGKVLEKESGGVYGNPVYGTDPEGNPVVMYADKSTGNLVRGAVPEGVRVTSPTRMVNLGDRQVAVDPRNPGMPVASYDVAPKPTETPEHVAKIEGAKQKAESEANKGKMWPKARDAYNSETDSYQFMIETIDNAIALAPEAAGWSTGGKVIPESAAGRLSDMLDTIKANIGFSYLQEIKRSSPTGGGVGSLSEREFENLAATSGSLRQTQDPQSLIRTLEQIKRRRTQLMSRLTEAMKDDYGDRFAPSSERNFEDEYGVDQ